MTTRPAPEGSTELGARSQPAALASLYRIAEAVNSDLGHDRVLQAVTDEATTLVGARFGAYFSHVEDDGAPAYRLSTLSGGDAAAFARFPRPRATPIFAPTFHGDGPLRLDDVTTDPRYGALPPHHGMPPGHPAVRSYLAVPVVARSGEVFGGLFFGHPEPGVFDASDEGHARVVATHAALAVEKARRFEAEQQARLDAEATTVRLALLQTLTAELASARDTKQVATALVASSEVGLGAESSVVYVEEQGAGDLVPVRPHSFGDALVDRLGRLQVSAALPMSEAFRRRQPVFCGSLEEGALRWPDLEAEEQGPTCALAALPLVTDGDPFGVVVLGWSQPQTFSTGERGFLSAVAYQCATALERARLYELQRDTAMTLQASLLPPRVQAPHGLELATRYRPVEQGAQVGGDFYDVFPVAPGRWGVVIGDVSGKGVRAASLTALARHTVRAAARSEPGPSLVLGVLNDELLEASQDHFCTVAYLEVEPDAEGCRVRLALAGHPQPLVRHRDGTLEPVGVAGMAAGLLPMAEVEDSELELAPGESIVLVTDGVVEARDPAGRFADDLLTATVATCDGCAEETADAVVEAAVSFAAGSPRDDIAVVVLRVPEPTVDGAAHDVVSIELPPVPGSVAQARDAVDRFCATHEMGGLAETAALLTSELVTNVVRHAATTSGLRLCRQGDVLCVEVTDGSRRRPVRRRLTPDVDSGRGLHLLERLAPDWGVRRTPEGKTVWFELSAD